MALFKSGNPALSEKTFADFQMSSDEANVMTIQGTVDKTAMLLILVMVSALYTWSLFMKSMDFDAILPYFGTGLIGGLLVAFVIIFKKEWSPYLSPVYALLEGLCLGGLSAAMNVKYPGIVLQASILTFSICLCLLVVYKSGLIKVTENFKLIVASATMGIAFYYVLSLILSFFNINLPLINDSSPIGIVFSLVVVVIASMNLVVDFDFIEQGVQKKAPKYMEWYGAFGVMVTLIWLYIELLRLLSKLRRR